MPHSLRAVHLFKIFHTIISTIAGLLIIGQPLIASDSFQSVSELKTYLFLQDPQYFSQWKNHQHIEHHQSTSKLDGPLFFLAPNGKTQTDSELWASYLAFQKVASQPDLKILSGHFNYPLQCVFLGRLHFFRTRGLFKELDPYNCPEFKAWVEGLKAKSISLVFSTSYPNNPSSLFGHTLLKLNQENKSGLLDYSLSFSAVPEGRDHGMVYALKGMFGGYKGLVEITKYYTKVNDYNHSESRDLVEYPLNLTPHEIEIFLFHAWEIYQTTYADYFFTDENCSSVLFDLLKVALKDKITKPAYKWYFLPADLIAAINPVIDFNRTSFRPSLKKKLICQFAKLNEEEKKFVLSSKRQVLSEEKLNFAYNFRVLDTTATYLDFLRINQDGRLQAIEEQNFRRALILRSQISGNDSEEVRGDDCDSETSFSREHLPHLAHQSQSILGSINQRKDLSIEYRAGYHHLTNADRGFDSFAEFSFFNLKGSYQAANSSFRLEKIGLIDLMSLHAYTSIDPQFSWWVTSALQREQSRLVFFNQISSGLSFELSDHSMAYYFLGPKLILKTKHSLDEASHRLALKNSLGYLARYSTLFKWGLMGEISPSLVTLNNRGKNAEFETNLELWISWHVKKNHDLIWKNNWRHLSWATKKDETLLEWTYAYAF